MDVVVGLLQRYLVEKEPSAWLSETHSALGCPKMSTMCSSSPIKPVELSVPDRLFLVHQRNEGCPIWIVSFLSGYQTVPNKEGVWPEVNVADERKTSVFSRRGRSEGHLFVVVAIKNIYFFTFFNEKFRNRMYFWRQGFQFQNWYFKKFLRNHLLICQSNSPGFCSCFRDIKK